MRLIVLALALAVCLPLLANWLYKLLVLRYTQEEQIRRGVKKRGAYRIVSFGSSYARYGFDFSASGLAGFNFGLMPQFLYYTEKMIRDFINCYKPGAYVIITLPDLVFAEPGKGKYGAERYASLLSKEMQGDEYSLYNELFVKRFPLLRPSLRNLKKCIGNIRRIPREYREYRQLHNRLDATQVEDAARRRCSDWIREFHLKDTQTDRLPGGMEQKMAESRRILTDTIAFCLSEGLKPVLVVTPVSAAMNRRLSEPFMKKVLYDNIAQANVQGIPFLDYMRDERFADAGCYRSSADLLNLNGRRKFTEIVVKEVIDAYERA